MHEVLVNRLGGLSLPRKSVVRLTDRPDMTLDAVDVKQQYNTINRIGPKRSDSVIKLVSVLFGKCTTLVITKC